MPTLPQSLSRRSVLAVLAGSAGFACAQSFLPGIPNIGLKGDNDPNRTECGIGALMPWADGLYAITYNSSGIGGRASGASSGGGLGLYRIDENLKSTQLDIVNGVHANRFIHHHSDQCIIGPYIIDAGGKWRRIESLLDHRLTSTMPHLTDPENRVYFQTMEGLFLEMDVADLKTRVLFNITADMNIRRRLTSRAAIPRNIGLSCPITASSNTARQMLVCLNGTEARAGAESQTSPIWMLPPGKIWGA